MLINVSVYKNAIVVENYDHPNHSQTVIPYNWWERKKIRKFLKEWYSYNSFILASKGMLYEVHFWLGLKWDFKRNTYK
ncbi:MAG: hypothetical protein WCT77_01880 [Bacteroidota bacterium]|jgi:hypothetical protein